MGSDPLAGRLTMFFLIELTMGPVNYVFLLELTMVQDKLMETTCLVLPPSQNKCFNFVLTLVQSFTKVEGLFDS